MKKPRLDESGNILCELCDKSFKYKKGLSKHLNYTHNYNLKLYYDTYLKDENEHLCVLCGNENKFISFRDGYNKFCGVKCLNKSKFPSNKEYWIYHGYNEEDSKTKVSEFQTLQVSKVKKHTNDATIEYWFKKGFTEDEAKLKIKERQSTGSKEKFIKKYGKEEGIEKFNLRQKKWQNTLKNKSYEEIKRINSLKGISLSNMIRKWGEIEGTRRYYQWLDKIHYRLKNNLLSYSKISQELFNILLNKIKDKDNVNFATYNKEISIINNNCIYFYDFNYKNKIIEFNGDIWHANPQIFDEYDKPNPHTNLTSKQIWEYDNKKVKAANDIGFDVLIIWEKNYKENSEKEINKCINFLLGNGN